MAHCHCLELLLPCTTLHYTGDDVPLIAPLLTQLKVTVIVTSRREQKFVLCIWPVIPWGSGGQQGRCTQEALGHDWGVMMKMSLLQTALPKITLLNMSVHWGSQSLTAAIYNKKKGTAQLPESYPQPSCCEAAMLSSVPQNGTKMWIRSKIQVKAVLFVYCVYSLHWRCQDNKFWTCLPYLAKGWFPE